jgi:hypothetical protein
MSLHIIKIAVGIDDIPHLRRVQKDRLAIARAAGAKPKLRHMTRMFPSRADEITDGGSIYWIVKGFVLVRQRIVAIEEVEANDHGKRCAFVLDPKLVPTVPQPRRPHQGWRYLKPEDAPVDARGGAADAKGLPPKLLAELRDLGLL